MIADRVQCLTATVGQGNVMLGAATPGYRSFASAFQADANVTYVITDGSSWETGSGTYSVANNTLTRAVDASSSGGLLDLSGSAVVSIAYLTRDHVGGWPVLIVTGSEAANTPKGRGFNQLAFNNVVTDTHGGWNSYVSRWAVPQSGLYDVQTKLRFADGSPAGVNYALGMDISNTDGPGVLWGTTQSVTTGAYRSGLLNRRVMPLTPGQNLRMFIYVDSDQQLTPNGIEMIAVRIR